VTKPDDQELRQRLTDMQYKVTQGHGTEAPFSGELNRVFMMLQSQRTLKKPATQVTVW